MTLEEAIIKNEIAKLANKAAKHPRDAYICNIQIKGLEKKLFDLQKKQNE